MRLSEILRDCEDRSVHLAAKPSGLSVRGEPGPELRAELKQHKSNILHCLRTGNCHHDLKPAACKVCNGYVKRLIGGAG